MMIIHTFMHTFIVSWKDNNKNFFCHAKRKEEKDAVVPFRFITTLFDTHATQRSVHTIPNRNTREGVQGPRLKKDDYGYTMLRHRQDRVVGSVIIIIDIRSVDIRSDVVTCV